MSAWSGEFGARLVVVSHFYAQKSRVICIDVLPYKVLIPCTFGSWFLYIIGRLKFK